MMIGGAQEAEVISLSSVHNVRCPFRRVFAALASEPVALFRLVLKHDVTAAEADRRLPVVVVVVVVPLLLLRQALRAPMMMMMCPYYYYYYYYYYYHFFFFQEEERNKKKEGRGVVEECEPSPPSARAQPCVRGSHRATSGWLFATVPPHVRRAAAADHYHYDHYDHYAPPPPLA
jgi:hypothetical protein